MTAFLSMLFSSGAPAADGLREWTDVTGEFKVSATFVRQTDRFVTLKKQDERVKILPKSRLSQADQDYLKTVSSKAAPNAASNPQNGASSASTPASRSALPDSAAIRPSADALDSVKTRTVEIGGEWKYKPVPTTWKVKDPKVSSKPIDRLFSYRVNCERTHVGAVMQNPFTKRNVVVVTDLNTGEEIHQIELEKDEDLFDVSNDGQRIVVGNKSRTNEENRLRILDASGKPLFYWDDLPEKTWLAKAWFIDSDFVLVQMTNRLLLWNWRKKQAVYRNEGGQYAQLTLKRDAIAWYRDHSGKRHVFFFDVRSGDPIGDFELPGDIFQTAFAFSPSGTKFATRDAECKRLDVWDLSTQPSKEQREPISLDHTSRHQPPLSWIGETFLLSGRELADTRLGVTCWLYKNSTGDLAPVYGNRFIGPARGKEFGRLATYRLPSVELVQKIRAVPKEQVKVFGQGGTVKLQAELEPMEEQDRAKTLQAIEETLKSHGLTVADDGEFTLVLSVKKMPPQTVQLLGPDRKIKNLPFNPYAHSIRLVYDRRELFAKSYTKTGRHTRPEKGESLQDAVDREAAPSSSFLTFNVTRLPFGVSVTSGKDGLLGRSDLMPDPVAAPKR